MRSHKATAFLLLFTLLVSNLAVAVSAQSAAQLPEGVTKGPSLGGVNEYNLKNGLKVLLIPDQSTQNATVTVVYKVGSRHEGYGETGMAHLLEHLVFKGTPKYPNIPGEMTKRGMSPNATTSFDRTSYFATFPVTGDNLEFYLDMEADRMTNSFIAKKDLDSEFSVVRNEMESGENDPLRVLLQRTMAAAFDWHNYGKLTIGARSDVENVKIENLQAFYRKYYQPDNAVVMVGGKIDEAKTLEMINQKFGAIPRPERKLEPTWTTDPPQDGERKVIVRRIGGEQIVFVGYHTPPASYPDAAALAILDKLMVESPTGRLYKALVDTKKAVSVLNGNFQLKEPGFALYGARLSKEQSVEEAEKILTETLENFAAAPPTKEEVDRYKSVIAKQLEDYSNNGNLMVQALTESIAQGDWRLHFLYLERLKNVMPEDVQRVAKTYLIQSNRTVGKFIPTDAPVRAPVKRFSDEEIVAMAEKAKAPEKVAEGEAFDSSISNIEARTKRSALGSIKTALLPKKTRGESVSLRLVMNIGNEKSLTGLNQTAGLVNSLMMMGTAKRSRQQIKEDLDRLRSTVSVEVGISSVNLAITSTRKNLLETLKIANEILKEPLFPQEEFDKAKTQRLAALESQRFEPQAIVLREMRRAFSNAKKGDYRYVPTLDEEIAAVNAVTLDAVKKFHKDFFGASNAQLAIVGDFDEKEVVPVIKDYFGNWKSATPFERVVLKYNDIPSVKKVFETPDKANAVFFARQNVKMSDSHPDYPAVTLGNFIFGGGFLNSRLAVRLRQKEGFSYSVASSFTASSEDELAAFSAQAIHAPENGEKLEKAFFEELNRVVTEGFTEDELKEAKQGWLLSRQRNRGNDAFLQANLASYLFLNRTLAWDDELEKKVQALTLAQLNAAFRKHIVPEKVSVFKAGDFAKTK
jgi:zinc protease